VPEIDTPGHTTSIAAAHPEHIACADASPWADFANEPPAGQLRFASPSTAAFTASLLSSAASLFQGTLFGTGGDELNLPCYANDMETQKTLKEKGWTLEHALDVFTQKNHAALRAQGKTAVVWEEMVLEHNVTLAPDTLVLCASGPSPASQLAHDSGVQGLDLVAERKGRRAARLPARARAFRLFLPRLRVRRVDRRHCGRDKLVRPLQVVAARVHVRPHRESDRRGAHAGPRRATAALDGAERAGQRRHATLAARGRVCRCARSASCTHGAAGADPRAELFWSGPAVTNVTEALPRFHDVAFRLAARGTRVTPVQPQWCALRPGRCGIDS
jgi:hexosaminidase